MKVDTILITTRNILESYYAVPFIALLAALMWPEQLAPISSHGALLISIIFFLSALKIDMTKVMHQFEDKTLLIMETVLMLVIYPAVVYFLALEFIPHLALPLLILAAMPAGMTSPFLTELAGGRQSLALVVTILTSLLAPLSIPLMIKLLAGEAVSVDYLLMMLSLAKVIIIPFILAQIVKRYATKLILRTHEWYRSISVLLLGILIAGIVAKQAHAIMGGIATGSTWWTLLVVTICFIGFHFLGYLAPFWRDKRDRITSAVCLSYMNFTLAVYLADTFFPDPSVMVPIVITVIPWALMFVPFRFIVHRTILAR